MSRLHSAVLGTRGLISLVKTVFTAIELLILLRTTLIFFNASASAVFVQWINELTNPLLRPFVGIFPSVTVGDGLVIEFYALFGPIVYAFIGYVITEALSVIASHAARRRSSTK